MRNSPRMQSEPLPEEDAQGFGREDKAEIVDRLYEVALDPIRLEDLLEVWEGRVAPYRPGQSKAGATLNDAELETHLRRATVFLDRFEATRDDGRTEAALEDITRSAACLIEDSDSRR